MNQDDLEKLLKLKEDETLTSIHLNETAHIIRISVAIKTENKIRDPVE